MGTIEIIKDLVMQKSENQLAWISKEARFGSLDVKDSGRTECMF